jgi:NAD(P)-dependent dehydrogenase (short-subunit alcohol dehydrogenase family)
MREKDPATDVFASPSPGSPREREFLVDYAAAHTIPVHRLGTADKQARAIWFLCTPGAAFTAGAMLDVDGGNGMG